MKITDTTENGQRLIRAVDETGTLAIAIAHEIDGATVWHLAPVCVPDGVTDPAGGFYPYPEVKSEQSARAWVEYLGEMTDRARRLAALSPVWCPADARETARAASAHSTERGVEVTG